MLQDCGNRAVGSEWVVGDLWSYVTTYASVTTDSQFLQGVHWQIWQSCWQSGNLVDDAAVVIVHTFIWARCSFAQAHTKRNNTQEGPRAFLMSHVVAKRGGSACMAREDPVGYVPFCCLRLFYFLALLTH